MDGLATEDNYIVVDSLTRMTTILCVVIMIMIFIWILMDNPLIIASDVFLASEEDLFVPSLALVTNLIEEAGSLGS